MKDKVLEIWPEINWIKDEALREKTLDAWTYALGYKTGFGENGVIKVEGFYSDYDSYSATSTTSNTVKANLDVVGAKLSIGIKF